MLILETNVTPPIPIFDEAALTEESSPLINLIRPRVSGSLPLVGSINYAPSGEPTPGLGSIVFGIIVIAAGYGIYTAARNLTR